MSQLNIIRGAYENQSISLSAEAEASPNIMWTLYDSDIKKTFDTLEPILEGMTLPDLANSIKKEQGVLRAIDVMGQGSRLVELGADEALALSLEFNQSKMMPDVNRDRLTLLASDVNSDETWAMISSLIQPAGLVICTPGDGVQYAWGKPFNESDRVEKFSDIIDHSLDLLSPGGVLLIESQASVRVVGKYIREGVYKKHNTSLTIVANPILSLLKITKNTNPTQETIVKLI